MPSSTGRHEDGSHQRVDLVTGSTFEGVPYQIALDSIAFNRGGSASIHKGRMLGSEPRVVAVKVFGAMLDPVQEKLLVRELRAARKLSLGHPSILGFLGTANIGEQTAIVSFYMGNGNMMAYMKANPGCDKKKLIVQVAEAVVFLHGSAGLVHGDIKCTNVLISDIGNALLADFGLSTLAEKPQFATATLTLIRVMNTLHFAAPELLLGDGETTLSKTRESDVYAFGMLILEAMSEQPPWGMKSDFAIMQAVCSGKNPERPTLDGAFVLISYSWWQICCECWGFNPRFRPPMHRVLSYMRNTEPVRRVECRVLPFQERMVFATYTPDGTTLVAVTYEGSIVLLDIATGHIRHLSPAFEGPDTEEFVRIAISPDGRLIACCVQETVSVLHAASGVQVTSMSHGSNFPCCVAFSRDGTRIASGAPDGIVRLWDAATGAAVGWELEGHRPHRRFSDLAFSPDGICLASASQDGTIRIWDTMTCTPMPTLSLGGSSSIYSMAFSAVSTHIVAGDDAGKVVIWDARKRRTTHTFETEWGASLHVAFSPSGRYVASAFKLGGIGIWDVRDSSQVGDPLDGPFGDVHFVTFSPDEKSLVSVARDWKVRVWDLFE